jgi:pimeloyl-ACP methyl ester carboxylesterase
MAKGLNKSAVRSSANSLTTIGCSTLGFGRSSKPDKEEAGLASMHYRFLYNHRMNRRNFLLSAMMLFAFFMAAVPMNAQDSLLNADPAVDKANPAAMQSFQLPSHGALLNAFVYIAAGATPHPTIILLHGFPGNERNLDLAQSIRRTGWNVLYFDYRGSWGSPGAFSFTHCIEDTQSAIDYLRNPVHAAQLHGDARTIVLAGHSMGGFMALQAGALDPAITAVITLSAADLGASSFQFLPADKRDAAVTILAAALAAEGMAPLAGTTPGSLATEVLSNASKWNFVNLAPKLATRPLLIITSDDGWSAPNDALVATVEKLGVNSIQSIHFSTDHAYSDHRIALQKAVLAFLASLNHK